MVPHLPFSKFHIDWKAPITVHFLYMVFQLGDIYIGDFPITQNFGARPEVYNARYNLKGHNGIDIGCPSLTLILAAADGFVSEIGNDVAGYGNYIKIVHDGYLTLYGHLNDIAVKKGDRVIAGQLIAHSNNTGFSDAPHLHFGVAPCDANGVKLDPNNGYSGYIDPSSSLCQWTIQNLTKPVDPTANKEEETKIPVPSSDFVRLVGEGSSFRVIANYLIQNGLNEFLASSGLTQIDLQSKTTDPKAGENITKFIGAKLGELAVAKTKLDQPTPPQQPAVTTEQVVATVEPTDAQMETKARKIVTTATPLTTITKKLFTTITAFIFVKRKKI